MLQRISNVRLPSSAILVPLLLGCVFLLRLPSALVPRELNVDESQMLSQAMKFLIDPRPWIAVDGTTSGPLNSYLISIFLLMGFKPGFILVHMLASALVCLQVLMAYLTLRRLGPEKTAALGAFLMVLSYGLATRSAGMDYLHYASELLPNLLLMVGFYIFLVWLDEIAGYRPGKQLSLLFLGGLAMGAAPWCKLQAVPISGVLGLVVLAAIFRDRGPSFNLSRRVLEVVAFGCGAVLTTCIMLAILAECGAIKDFWYSYIIANLSYSGSLGSTRNIISDVRFILLTSPLRELFLVVMIGVCLLVYVSQGDEIPVLFKKQRWAFGGFLCYAGAALFAVFRASVSFSHHKIFLMPPMTYAAAVLASCGVIGLTRNRQRPQRLTAAILLVLLSVTMALYVAYGIRYAYMIKDFREPAPSGADLTSRITKVVPDLQKADSNGGIAKVRDERLSAFHALSTRLRGFIGAAHWVLGDSNERIVAVVRDIQKTRPVRSLAIWGWTPGVYVLAGIPPATRDSIGHEVISKGPLQKYFRTRFVSDLRANPPDMFIDAVAPGAFMWLWNENDGYESAPEVRKFVEDNYLLVEELTLINGAKPVRFFVRCASGSIH